MLFREWLIKECKNRVNKPEIHLFNELICNDGTSLSVQASQYHMCSPRKRLDNGIEYKSVEVYSHGEYIFELTNYARESFIYGYVPVEVMEELVEKHGGIKEN